MVYAKKGILSQNEELFKKFTYATRYTTHRFLEKLIENSGVINNFNGKKLNQEISEQWWYNTSWNDDINIRSCLAMLDEIDLCFKDKKIFVEDIAVENLNKITFMFLELEGFGSANELYIKMNSRGKQLTDFENFKAELYEKFEQEDWGHNKNCGFDFDDFKKKVDSDWLSCLYKIFADEDENVEENANKADELFIELFHSFFINVYCTLIKENFIERRGRDELKNKFKKEFNELFYNTEVYFLDNYFKLKLSSEKNGERFSVENMLQVLEDLYNTFNMLCRLDKDILVVISKEIFISKDKEIILAQYKNRVILCALTAYSKKIFKNGKQFKNDEFKAWYRVILNLVKNTTIDKEYKFKQVVGDIYRSEYICDKERICKNLDCFEYIQCAEEIEKLERINKSDEWKQAIYAAEGWYEGTGGTEFKFEEKGVNYFGGQIYFLLHMAKEDVGKFTDYCQKVFKIFSDKDKYDLPFHRALLCYDNYSIQFKGTSIFTFFRNRDKNHTYDWRGAFKMQSNGNWHKALGCLEQLLEKWNGSEDFDDFTNKLCDEYLNAHISSGELRDELVNYKIKSRYLDNYNVLEYIRGSGFYMVEKQADGDWLLMTNSTLKPAKGKERKYLNGYLNELKKEKLEEADD